MSSLADSPAPKLALNEIFTRHNIAPQFRDEFAGLISGTPVGTELRCRLNTVANYRECFEEILARLSEPFAHLFKQHESATPGVEI